MYTQLWVRYPLNDDVLQIYSSMSTMSWTLDIELSPKIRNSFILNRVMSLVFYTCITCTYIYQIKLSYVPYVLHFHVIILPDKTMFSSITFFALNLSIFYIKYDVWYFFFQWRCIQTPLLDVCSCHREKFFLYVSCCKLKDLNKLLNYPLWHNHKHVCYWLLPWNLS